MFSEQYLIDFTSKKIISFFLIFARFGPAIALMPGFGELFVSPRIRVALAFAITLALFPILEERLPINRVDIFACLFREMLFGVFVGMILKLATSALEIAGSTISMQSGLSAGTFFNPFSGQGESAYGVFFTTAAITLFFISDLHHLFFRGLVNSYDLSYSDLFVFTKFVSQSFKLAMHIAAPFFVSQLIFFFAAGLVNRIITQIQVYFVAQPLQILIGFFIMMISITSAMTLFLEFVKTSLFSVINNGR